MTLDREEKGHYELVVVARDHGTPVAFETLRDIINIRREAAKMYLYM